ncbi:DsbA family protein [Natronorarus salvus]|uniref:DsbA family protein n=1 Tax=Natronorarus salvus TaxID=3117733 RepID=UPI002F26006C
MKRRALLTTAGLGLVGVAGCVADDAGSGSGGNSSDDPEETPTETPDRDDEGNDDAEDDGDDNGDEEGEADDDGAADDEQVGDGDGGETDNTPSGSAAARDVMVQPRMGDPAEATATIVEFTDPACDVCRSFHARTFPQVVEELVEPGDAAYVARVYPTGRGIWPEVASKALLATWDQQGEVFWELLHFYFQNQNSLNRNNIDDRTREFLAEFDGVDGDEVVQAARGGEYDEAFDVNVSAGQNAGTGRTTPSFYLFRDGQYVTRVTGHQNVRVFRSALEL